MEASQMESKITLQAIYTCKHCSQVITESELADIIPPDVGSKENMNLGFDQVHYIL